MNKTLDIMEQVNYFFFEAYKVHGNDPNMLLNRPDVQHIMPWTAVVLYLIMLVVVPKFIKKPIPGIKLIMAVWNFFLAVLSVMMFIGLFVPWFKTLLEYGGYNTVCSQGGVNFVDTPLSMCFWGYVFVISKYIELLDTFWMMCNNKPVELLHWWHHVSVLLFTWYASMWQTSLGWIFSSMNSLIHSFMYTYYFLMSIGYKPSWAKLLTIGQITQMIIGTAVNAYFFYNYYHGIPCECTRPDLMMVACSIIYGSYLILFLRFYFKRYVFVKPKKTEKKKEE
eukprot:gene3517-6164_t